MTAVSSETRTKLTLVEEIHSYLAVVDAFRALGAYPTWTSEAPWATHDVDRSGGPESARHLPFSEGSGG